MEYRCSSAFALPLSEVFVREVSPLQLDAIESLDKHPERPEIHLKFEPC